MPAEAERLGLEYFVEVSITREVRLLRIMLIVLSSLVVVHYSPAAAFGVWVVLLAALIGAFATKAFPETSPIR